ncbi:hypothetical protein FGJ01_16925 [Hydrogenophaga intermedia]|nr:hypothetical protein FGJ01_16925 [Hydrogenophaga intermedia]
MSTAQVPLNLDWQFWSAVVALLALVLTQLPPIKLWFRPTRLEVEVHSRVQLTHKVGNPNFGMYVGIRNIGGRDIRVRTMSVSLSRDGQVLGTYPIFNFFETPSSSSAVLFVPFTLRPSETWAHGSNFLRVFDRNTEKLYRERESILRSDIRRKLAAREECDKELVVAEPENVAPFMEMFDRLFVFLPGEYTLDLRIDADSSKPVFGRRYRFTLFESDSEELRSHTEDYKHGGGLAYNVDRHAGVFIPLSPSDA